MVISRHHAVDVRKNVANYHLNGELSLPLILKGVIYCRTAWLIILKFHFQRKARVAAQMDRPR